MDKQLPLIPLSLSSSNLFQAALNDDVGELELGLAKGENINQVDPETGMTPLHVAAQSGSLAFIRRATQEPSLERRAYDDAGMLPFQYAAERGDDEAKRLLHAHVFGEPSAPQFLH